MCGIVGVCSSGKITSRSWLEKGSEAITHRGPDDFGEFWSQNGMVGLAHRRLSIIDLTPAGHQPMINASGDLVIVFNGEIYNFIELRGQLLSHGYTFNTQSDTEVILAAYSKWGADCLKYLDGMFSFAIYDSIGGKVFFARDRAGEKPMYYYYDNGTLFFASELKALLANRELPRKIDPISFDCYLSMGYIPGELCILKGYNKLPPAHAMEFNIKSGGKKIWKYWEIPNKSVDQSISPSDLLDKYENILESSVKKQLIADVPVGVLLSGGVDSSLITAMAARSSNKVKTFTVRFPGHASIDETGHARLIAKYFNTEHIELEASSASAELIPLLARQFDEPIADSSMIPTYLVSNLIHGHCSVALGGDGGDELFGGYGHHSRLLWMEKYLKNAPYFLRKNVSSIAGMIMPVGMKGRNWLQGLKVDLREGVPLIANYFDLPTRRKLISTNIGNISAEDVLLSNIPNSTDVLQRVTRMDFENYLPEDILVKVDRSSMLNSLEIRAPMLDRSMIEFAYKEVPSFLKATVEDKKILPKMLAAKVLPPEFDKKRKQGFSIPLSEWIKEGEFRDLFHDTLLNSSSIFNITEVKKMLRNQDRGCSNSERLFSLVLFELWRKEYGVEF
jgi:asparagine synthase (glutamine-hydrolysing)